MAHVVIDVLRFLFEIAHQKQNESKREHVAFGLVIRNHSVPSFEFQVLEDLWSDHRRLPCRLSIDSVVRACETRVHELQNSFFSPNNRPKINISQLVVLFLEISQKGKSIEHEVPNLGFIEELVLPPSFLNFGQKGLVSLLDHLVDDLR